MVNLEEKLEAFIHEQHLLSPGQSLVLAVSGGVDSTVMLSLFAGLSRRWKLKITVAHVNHGLRGEESDGDEEFVQHAASTLGVPFFAERVPTLDYAHAHKVSKQEAARTLRYEFLEKIRAQASADAIATAHQANDNAETVFLNLLRGTGVRGLAGIPVRRDPGAVIRPLLFAYRSELEEYATSQNIAYREDSSNKSTAYTRNLVRQVVLPGLQQQLGSDIWTSLNRVSSVMRGLEQSLSLAVGQKLPAMIRESENRLAVSLPLLMAEPEYLQEEILLALLRREGVEPSAEKVLNLLRLCSQPTGRSIRLTDKLAAYRNRDDLVFGPPLEDSPFDQPVVIGGTYTFGKFTFSIGEPEPVPSSLVRKEPYELADADRLKDGLVLRTWRPGDWFVPLGMNTRKKVSDFLIDEKVPLFEKSEIPVLESQSEIVWVCGKRLDDRFKIRENTRSVVKLFYHQYV
ncbi:MAG: tRNA lysidine(34) synthetase TilS [Bacteroidota bacterium]